MTDFLLKKKVKRNYITCLVILLLLSTTLSGCHKIVPVKDVSFPKENVESNS